VSELTFLQLTVKGILLSLAEVSGITLPSCEIHSINLHHLLKRWHGPL